MNVAIFAGRDRSAFETKSSFRCLTRGQKLAVGFALGVDYFNPFNVMLLFHGMRDATDLNFDAIGRLLDYRDMLFFSGIDGVFHISFHRLPTAYQFTLATVDHFDYVST